MSLTKTINITAYLTLGIAAVMMLYFGYLLWWPVKVYDSSSLVTNKTVYYPGDPIQWTDTYCKYKALPVKISALLSNGLLYHYTPIERNAPVGCSKVVSDIRYIPEYAEPGIYHVEITLEYKINLLRSESYKQVSNNFEILVAPEYE